MVSPLSAVSKLQPHPQTPAEIWQSYTDAGHCFASNRL
jgi:hypothetical protein